MNGANVLLTLHRAFMKICGLHSKWTRKTNKQAYDMISVWM